MGNHAASVRPGESCRSRYVAGPNAPATPGSDPWRPRGFRRWPRCGLAPLVLLLLLPALAVAGPTSGQAEVEELEEVYRGALEHLYRWCRNARLNGTADVVAEELIELDPEHESARRWLGYKHRQGAWVAPERPKIRKDWNRAAKRKYPERRAKNVESLVERYWELHQDLQGDEAAEARQRLLSIAIQRWPQDARFRKAAGEVQRDGLWILKESARSKIVYGRLKTSARRLLDAAPTPSDTSPPLVLEPFGLHWRGASRIGDLRVVSMTSPEESDRVAQHCYVAVKLFHLIFGVESQLPRGYTVALGGSEEDFQGVISRIGVPEPMQKELRRSSGVWWPGLRVLFASSSYAAARLDAAVRNTVDLLRERTFGDFGRLGWVTEGIGTYLTWLVCGTRISSYGALGVPTKTRRRRGGPSRNLGEDWLANARRLAASGKLPELTYVVSVDHRAMTSSDLLAAYAFAVYLVTARPGEVQRFLSAADDGKATADAALEVLGSDLPKLDARLRRWLGECH